MPTVRLIASVTLFCCGSATLLGAQAPIDSRVRNDLTVAREAVWRAFFQGDSVALVRLLPEQMIAMGRDRAAIIADAQAFAKRGGTFVGMDFTENEFFVNGNTAVVWSHYVARLTDSTGRADSLTGRAIELFVKQHGRWVNPHWHLDGEK